MPRYATRAPSTAPSAYRHSQNSRDESTYLGRRRGTVAHRVFGRCPQSAGFREPNTYYSLEEAMDIRTEELRSLITLMRAKAIAYLDRTLPLQEQDTAKLGRYIAECSSLPELRRYRDGRRCWPARVYAKLYLSRTSRRLRSNELNTLPLETEPDGSPATLEVGNNSSGDSDDAASGYLQIDSVKTTEQSSSFSISRERKSPISLGESAVRQGSSHAAGSPTSTPAADSIELASASSLAMQDSAVHEFVLRMHPAQPQLYQVLVNAGIRSIAHLEFLAGETSRARVFLDAAIRALL